MEARAERDINGREFKRASRAGARRRSSLGSSLLRGSYVGTTAGCLTLSFFGPAFFIML